MAWVQEISRVNVRSKKDLEAKGFKDCSKLEEATQQQIPQTSKWLRVLLLWVAKQSGERHQKTAWFLHQRKLHVWIQVRQVIRQVLLRPHQIRTWTYKREETQQEGQQHWRRFSESQTVTIGALQVKGLFPLPTNDHLFSPIMRFFPATALLPVLRPACRTPSP